MRSQAEVGSLIAKLGFAGIDLGPISIGAYLARCVRRCENGQLKEHSANSYFDLDADAPDGGPMNAKETSDFSCRTAFI